MQINKEINKPWAICEYCKCGILYRNYYILEVKSVSICMKVKYHEDYLKRWLLFLPDKLYNKCRKWTSSFANIKACSFYLSSRGCAKRSTIDVKNTTVDVRFQLRNRVVYCIHINHIFQTSTEEKYVSQRLTQLSWNGQLIKKPLNNRVLLGQDISYPNWADTVPGNLSKRWLDIRIWTQRKLFLPI